MPSPQESQGQRREWQVPLDMNDTNDENATSMDGEYKQNKENEANDKYGQDRTMRIAYMNHIHGSLCYCSGLGGYVKRIAHLPSLTHKCEMAFVHQNQHKVIPQPPLQHLPLHANMGHVDCCACECNSTARPTTMLCSTHQRVCWCVCSTSKH
jgi:hypothetical protein